MLLQWNKQELKMLQNLDQGRHQQPIQKVIFLLASMDPMTLPDLEEFEIVQPLWHHSRSLGTVDQPEDSATQVEQEGDLKLVVLQASWHLELYSLYFCHCKPTNRNKYY